MWWLYLDESGDLGFGWFQARVEFMQMRWLNDAGIISG
jgi:hypothetical protein